MLLTTGLAQLTELKALTRLNVNEEFEERRDPYRGCGGDDEVKFVRLHITEVGGCGVQVGHSTRCMQVTMAASNLVPLLSMC